MRERQRQREEKVFVPRHPPPPTADQKKQKTKALAENRGPPSHLEHVPLGRQAVRQVLQFRHPVRQPDGQLVVQELGRQAELALDRVGPEIQHVLQRHARLLFEGAREDVVHDGAGDGVHQAGGRPGRGAPGAQHRAGRGAGGHGNKRGEGGVARACLGSGHVGVCAATGPRRLWRQAARTHARPAAPPCPCRSPGRVCPGSERPPDLDRHASPEGRHTRGRAWCARQWRGVGARAPTTTIVTRQPSRPRPSGGSKASDDEGRPSEDVDHYLASD